MVNDSIAVRFSETPIQELSYLARELRIGAVLDELKELGEAAPNLQQFVDDIGEMFSLELPDMVNGSVDDTLRRVARDNNLSRILRERAYMRAYRLLTLQDENNLPVYLSLQNPDTNEPFMREPDFIRWLCKSAFITQATLFQRIATYKKLQFLGYSLEDTFQTVVNRPSAIREALNMVAEWTASGDLERISPAVVTSLQRRYPIPEAEQAVQAYENFQSPENLDRVMPALHKQIRDLVEDVANHPNTRQVLAFVQHDVLGRPDIKYRIDPGGVLTVIIIEKLFADGQEHERRVEIPFVPPTDDTPPAVYRDLVERLPILNRVEVNATLELHIDSLPY